MPKDINGLPICQGVFLNGIVDVQLFVRLRKRESQRRVHGTILYSPNQQQTAQPVWRSQPCMPGQTLIGPSSYFSRHMHPARRLQIVHKRTCGLPASR